MGQQGLGHPQGHSARLRQRRVWLLPTPSQQQALRTPTPRPEAPQPPARTLLPFLLPSLTSTDRQRDKQHPDPPPGVSLEGPVRRPSGPQGAWPPRACLRTPRHVLGAGGEP